MLAYKTFSNLIKSKSFVSLSTCNYSIRNLSNLRTSFKKICASNIFSLVPEINSFLKCSSLFCSSFSTSSSGYDVVVIGGGPGGYVAAIKCAQSGLKTACVEGRGTLGGTCLNVGCIPSKAILNISQKYYELQHDFEDMGINVSGCNMDVAKMMQKKQKIVKGLTDGIEYLFKKNKVDYIKGWGSISSPTSVTINSSSSQKEINCRNIILATGSKASPFPANFLSVDEKVVLSSTGALELKEPPKRMIVIGGGVIGLELGSVWNRFGTQVEVIEFLDRLCPSIDSEIVKAFQRSLEKTGIKFHLNTKVSGGDIQSNSVTIHTESATKGGEKKSFNADVVLVAVGRRPNTSELNLEKLGIELDKQGRVIVDDDYRIPNFPTIRAIGDIIKGPMLAHKAEEEAIYVSESISGLPTGELNYLTIPSVVYTHPELAGVGFTEDQLKQQNTNYKKGIFPFGANSRAKTNQDTDGMVKILADASTDRILGGWILGPYAGELIGELVLAMEYGASSEDIARTTHAHPTLSEAVKEACMAIKTKPIHFA